MSHDTGQNVPELTRGQRALRASAWLAALLTLVLIVVGGLVTSLEVGMSVPDWPTTEGDNMFTAKQAESDAVTVAIQAETTFRPSGPVPEVWSSKPYRWFGARPSKSTGRSARCQSIGSRSTGTSSPETRATRKVTSSTLRSLGRTRAATDTSVISPNTTSSSGPVGVPGRPSPACTSVMGRAVEITSAAARVGTSEGWRGMAFSRARVVGVPSGCRRRGVGVASGAGPPRGRDSRSSPATRGAFQDPSARSGRNLTDPASGKPRAVRPPGGGNPVSSPAMKIYLDTLGCRLNEAELQRWNRDFRAAGHRPVPDAADAELLVLNTCAVTAEAARKSRQFVRRLHRQAPSAPVVVTGCFAELDPDRAADLPGVDLVIGNADKDRLVPRVLDALDVPAMPEAALDPDGAHAFAERRTRAFVKVQDGCRHRCTYCIVTVARGSERSRPIDTLVDEIHALEREGVKEVVLTGVHLGGYGHDLDTDLRSLVETVLARTTVPRVRLSSLEPWDLPPGFFELWRNPRLMPHLHLPLQSGSDRILRRMGRRCDVATFRSLAATARAAIPDLTLTTDVIVGFPGETDHDFDEGLAAIREVGFGHVHAFTFSPRAGTAAARYPDPVPNEVKRERARVLHEVAAGMKSRHLARFAGSDREVLLESVENTTTLADDRHEVWTGYTDNYLRTRVRIPRGRDLRNELVPVALSPGDGATLTGTPIAVEAPIPRPVSG